MKLELAVSTNLSRLKDMSSSPWERELDKPERASASMANGAGIRIQDPEQVQFFKGFPNEYREMSSRGCSERRFAPTLSSFLCFFPFGTRGTCDLVLHLTHLLCTAHTMGSV